jgi:hypothetical protein
LAQQQLRQPVPRRHQIPADILAGPHQVPRGFLLDAGHRDRDDLPPVQQAGQMPGVAHVGLDPVPGRALHPRRRRDPALNPSPDQAPGQTKPRRAGLIRDRYRTRQRPDPPLDITMLRGQPALEQLTGPPVQTTRHDRAPMHIQPDTPTIPAHLDRSRFGGQSESMIDCL